MKRRPAVRDASAPPDGLLVCWVQDWLSGQELAAVLPVDVAPCGDRDFRLALLAWRRWKDARAAWSAEPGGRPRWRAK